MRSNNIFRTRFCSVYCNGAVYNISNAKRNVKMTEMAFLVSNGTCACAMICMEIPIWTIQKEKNYCYMTEHSYGS